MWVQSSKYHNAYTCNFLVTECIHELTKLWTCCMYVNRKFLPGVVTMKSSSSHAGLNESYDCTLLSIPFEIVHRAVQPVWSCLSAFLYSMFFLSVCPDGLTAIKKWSMLQLGIKVSTTAVHRGLFPSTIVQTAANVVSQSTAQGGWCFVTQIQIRLWCEYLIAWTIMKKMMRSLLVVVLLLTRKERFRECM